LPLTSAGANHTERTTKTSHRNMPVGHRAHRFLQTQALPVQFGLCVRTYLSDNTPELDKQRTHFYMAMTDIETCRESLQLAKRRTCAYGKWFPMSFWVDAMSRSIDGIDHNKRRKALEKCGMCMTQIKDSAHKCFFIEATVKKIDVGRRWFICASTDMHPDVASKQDDRKAFLLNLQRSWQDVTRPQHQ